MTSLVVSPTMDRIEKEKVPHSILDDTSYVEPMRFRTCTFELFVSRAIWWKNCSKNTLHKKDCSKILCWLQFVELDSASCVFAVSEFCMFLLASFHTI